MKPGIVKTVRYEELTVEQAEYVDSHYPANTDPWRYEYDILAGRVIDRYLVAVRVTA